MKVSELISMLVLNCKLDDEVVIEYCSDPNLNTYAISNTTPHRVTRINPHDGTSPEAIIECYD